MATVVASGACGEQLNPREIAFVYHYLENGGKNGAAAAIAAGYAESSAKVQASRLLSNPRVREVIDRHMKKSLDKLEVSRDRILTELARIAFFDIRKCFNDDGSLKKITELDDDTAAALAGMDVIELEGESESWLKKFKATDKKGALELLGKHLKMFTDKVEVHDNRPRVRVIDRTGKKQTGE